MGEDLGKIDAFCSSCNVHVEARVLAHHELERTVIREDFLDPTDRSYTSDVYTFAYCIRCSHPILVVESHTVVDGFGFPQGDVCVVYPTDTTLPEAVPDVVARPFKEALQACEVQLYSSCVAMCRKTLEAVCREYGETAGRLAVRLDRLLERGVIDRAMFEWAQELRLTGNKGVHADPETVAETEAKDMIEFARALLLYAYELPKRLQRSGQRRVSRKNDQPDESTGSDSSEHGRSGRQ